MIVNLPKVLGQPGLQVSQGSRAMLKAIDVGKVVLRPMHDLLLPTLLGVVPVAVEESHGSPSETCTVQLLVGDIRLGKRPRDVRYVLVREIVDRNDDRS